MVVPLKEVQQIGGVNPEKKVEKANLSLLLVKDPLLMVESRVLMEMKKQVLCLHYRGEHKHLMMKETETRQKNLFTPEMNL